MDAVLAPVGATVRAPISVSGANMVLLDGTSVNGPLSVNGTKTSVVLTGLHIQAPLSVTGNTG